MNFLTPLGFTALISIIILIVIHIIKPNYQQKYVSSTFVWKLSLKYKRRKIPFDFLRNLLLILCQIAILSICAFVLTKPVVPAESITTQKGKIIIIDACANMLAIDNETLESRFDRAIDSAIEMGKADMTLGNSVSVIISAKEANLLINNSQDPLVFESTLANLIGTEVCSYGDGDTEGAIDIAEDILLINPLASVVFFTATDYVNVSSDIDVIDVSAVEDWNAGILDCKAELDGSYYKFTVTIASYIKGATLPIDVKIEGVETLNENVETVTNTYTFTDTVSCYANTVTEYVIAEIPVGLEYKRIPSFDTVTISINANDSFAKDNIFYVYGGKKPTIKIQYASTKKNVFWEGMVNTIMTMYGSDYQFIVRNVTKEPATQGYDFYIYEETMPTIMPTDGVVMLFNPDKKPSTLSDINLKASITSTGMVLLNLSPKDEHEVMANIVPYNFAITKYTPVVPSANAGYSTIMSCSGDPVVVIKNEPLEKVMIFGFSLNFSDLAMKLEFPRLINNIFNYYFPKIVDKNVYNVYENVNLSARGYNLQVGGQENMSFEESKGSFEASKPGTYTITQNMIDGTTKLDSIYVKTPSSQSDFNRKDKTLLNPTIVTVEVAKDQDLLFYFALALVIMLFAEWFLYNREKI